VFQQFFHLGRILNYHICAAVTDHVWR